MRARTFSPRLGKPRAFILAPSAASVTATGAGTSPTIGSKCSEASGSSDASKAAPTAAAVPPRMITRSAAAYLTGTDAGPLTLRPFRNLSHPRSDVQRNKPSQSLSHQPDRLYPSPLAKCRAPVESAKLMVLEGTELFHAGEECGIEANAGFEACHPAMLTLGGWAVPKGITSNAICAKSSSRRRRRSVRT